MSISSRLQTLHAYLIERSKDPSMQSCFVLQTPTISKALSWSITDSAQEIHVSLQASPDYLGEMQAALGPENSDCVYIYKNGSRLD